MTEEQILELVKGAAAQIANIIKSVPPQLVPAVQEHTMIILKQRVAMPQNPDYPQAPLVVNGDDLVKVVPEPEPAMETPAEPQADQTESP